MAKAKKSVKKKTIVKKVVKKKVAVKKAVAKKPVKKIIAKAPVVKKITKIVLNDFVTPLDNRIIVQVEPGERVTAGGLIIPDTVEGEVGHKKGRVLAVGRGHRDSKGKIKPMDVQVGDQILFQGHGGSKLTYQSVDLLILRETDVMGVINQGK